MQPDETQALIHGTATGKALVLDAPLSFWGGLDPETGCIIDRRHPQCGLCVTGRVLVMPAGRGSSSSSNVLAESIRLGTSPVAIVLRYADEIIVLGAVVAEFLYGRVIPILRVDESSFRSLRDGLTVTVEGAVLSIDENAEAGSS